MDVFSLLTLSARPYFRAAALGRFHRHLAEVGAAAARALASHLAAAGVAPRAILDAGGGTGAYLAAFLDAWPSARATLVDRAEVVALARAALARLGDRVDF